MKIEIKRWWDAKILFTAEVPDDTDERLRLKLAVELAVSAGASLVGASLVGARLDGASLDGARLDGASLDGASLDGARLVGARGVDWTPIRDDLWAVLSSAPREAQGLRDALAAGKVNGSQYQGECACLVGTIANVRGKHHDSLGVLKPNAGRAAERFFLGIKTGDTPETNPLSTLALEWVDQWLAAMHDAFGEKVAA